MYTKDELIFLNVVMALICLVLEVFFAFQDNVLGMFLFYVFYIIPAMIALRLMRYNRPVKSEWIE